MRKEHEKIPIIEARGKYTECVKHGDEDGRLRVKEKRTRGKPLSNLPRCSY